MASLSTAFYGLPTELISIMLTYCNASTMVKLELSSQFLLSGVCWECVHHIECSEFPDIHSWRFSRDHVMERIEKFSQYITSFKFDVNYAYFMSLLNGCMPRLTRLTIDSLDHIAGNFLRSLLAHLNPAIIQDLKILGSNSRIIPALEQLATSSTGFRNLTTLSLQVPTSMSAELKTFMIALATGSGRLEELELLIQNWFQFHDVAQSLKLLSENNSKTFKRLSINGLPTFGTSAERSIIRSVFHDTLHCELSSATITSTNWKQIDLKCKEHFGVHISGFTFLNQKLWSAVTATFCNFDSDFSTYDELFVLCYGSRPSFQATDAICGGWGDSFTSACASTVIYFCSKALLWLSDQIWSAITYSEARAAIQCGLRLFDGVQHWLHAHPDKSSVSSLLESIYQAIFKYLSYNPTLFSFYASSQFIRRYLDDVPPKSVDFYHIWNDFSDSFKPLEPFLEEIKVLRKIFRHCRDAIFWFSPDTIVPDLMKVEGHSNKLLKNYLRCFKEYPEHQRLLEILDVDALTRIIEEKSLRKLFFKMLASNVEGVKLITFLLSRVRGHPQLDDTSPDSVRDIISSRFGKVHMDATSLSVCINILQQELPQFGGGHPISSVRN